MPRTDPFIGMAISDGSVRALALSPGTLQAVAASQVSLTGTLGEALREAVRALHVRPAGAAAALGLDRVTVRRMSLPRTTAGNVDRVVRFEAERHIPLAIQDVELDYQADVDTAADRLDVVLAAVRKEEAAEVSQALAEAVTAPTVVDAAATALQAAWHGVHGDQREAALLVDLTGPNASLVVCEGPSLVLARSVPTGVSALRAALAADLKVTPGEAEEVRRTRGVAGAEVGPPDLVATPGKAGLEATSEWLTRLVQEVRRTLESFRGQRGGLAQCTVALTGEGAETPGLQEALAGAVSDPVTLFDPLAGQAISLPGPGHHFTLAYGLALRAAGRSPIAIDLSPRGERAGRERRHQATGRLGVLAVIVLALVAAYVFTGDRLQRMESELVQAQEEVKRLEQQVGDLDAALADAAAVTEVGELIAGLDRPEAQPLDLLQAVSVSLPGGVWLSDFFYDQGKGVSIRGNALDAASVTEAVRALSRRPYLVAVKLNSIAIVPVGDKQVYGFEITGDFAQPEESVSRKEARPARERS